MPPREPVIAGRNVICTAQEVPAATPPDASTQLSVSWKSPVVTIWLNASGALPVFVTVMVCAALSVPNAWAENVRLGGLSVIAGAAGPAAVSSGISQTPRP